MMPEAKFLVQQYKIASPEEEDIALSNPPNKQIDVQAFEVSQGVLEASATSKGG